MHRSVGVNVRGDGKREWRKGGFGRAWGNGMGGMKEGWLWEQGSKYFFSFYDKIVL